MIDTTSLLRLLGQLLIFALFAWLIAYFSSAPAYLHMDDKSALLKLSFSHGGARKGGCRRLTPEELAALPANMRAPLDCPRQRVPVVVELEVDGTPIYHEALQPGGIAGDGPSTVYRRFKLPVGQHRIVARLRDTERDSGFDYQADTIITLTSRQSMALDFRAETGEFQFH